MKAKKTVVTKPTLFKGMSEATYAQILKKAQEAEPQKKAVSGNKGTAHVYTEEQKELWNAIKLNFALLSEEFGMALEAGFEQDFESTEKPENSLFFRMTGLLAQMGDVFPNGYKKKAANSIQPLQAGQIHATFTLIQIGDEEFKFVPTKLEPSFSTTVPRILDIDETEKQGKPVTIPLPGTIIGYNLPDDEVVK